MAFRTEVRKAFNRVLKHANLGLVSLTLERQEEQRLEQLVDSGHFRAPAYALSPGMAEFDHKPMARLWKKHAAQIERLKSPQTNDVGYIYKNNFYRTPDMEVLYCLMRDLNPARLVEIGCGSSTRISRQAIIDGKLKTRVTAIDPWPRVDIAEHVDEFIQSRLEEVGGEVFEALEPGDILFIDSSHQVRLGNDVARQFCDIIPRLKPGVVVHVHDVFLPFEYPEHLIRYMRTWGEQYVLHALLQGRKNDLIWPGYYVQQMRPEALKDLPFLDTNLAQSFWFRIS